MHSSIVRRELPVLIGIMLIAWLLLADGRLGRLDGTLLVAGMVPMLAWMTHLGMKSRGSRDAMDEEFGEEIRTGMGMPRALFWLLVGSVFLLLSSRLLVWGAVSVAQRMGISELVIGLAVVALGTSLPELAASLVSAIKKEHDIAIGNIIGSNIFNLLVVLGLPGIINPGPIDPQVIYRDFPVMFAMTLSLFVMAYGIRGPGRITRLEGAMLLTAYSAYQTLLYFSETARLMDPETTTNDNHPNASSPVPACRAGHAHETAMNKQKLQELALAVIDTEARAVSALADEIRQPAFSRPAA